MARGNDADAARRDLDSQYGEGHQSAEDLIAAHDEALDPVRIAALNKPVDAVATQELDPEDIKPQYGGVIIAFAVRGGVLIVVEDVDGDYKKWHDADSKLLGKNAQAKQAARQAAASQGVPEAQPAQATAPAVPAATPERTGAFEPTPQIDTTQPPVVPEPGADGQPVPDGQAQVAPKNVTVGDIDDKLAELGIDVPSDVRNKDPKWALLPQSAQDELKAAADQS